MVNTALNPIYTKLPLKVLLNSTLHINTSSLQNKLQTYMTDASKVVGENIKTMTNWKVRERG